MGRPKKDPRQKKQHVAIYLTGEEKSSFDRTAVLLGVEKQALARAAIRAVVYLAERGDLCSLQVMLAKGFRAAGDEAIERGS